MTIQPEDSRFVLRPLRGLVLLALGGGLVMGADNPHLTLLDQFYKYEPNYYAVDPGFGKRDRNSKFQVSFAIRTINLGDESDQGMLRSDGGYLAFSQTTAQDLQARSAPFIDTSYRPEVWWHFGVPASGLAEHLALEPGVGHESNGKSGTESRSFNHVFVRVPAQWQIGEQTLLAQPRARIYLSKEADFAVQHYRGYVDWVASLGRAESWQIACTARIGDQFEHGSLQTEVTYPLAPLSRGVLAGYLYAQVFIGYSETLVAYDQRSDPPHVLLGYALTR